jgi:hypothetical protein
MPYRAGKCVIFIDFQTGAKIKSWKKNTLASENDKACLSISIMNVASSVTRGAREYKAITTCFKLKNWVRYLCINL